MPVNWRRRAQFELRIAFAHSLFRNRVESAKEVFGMFLT
jgi:hypothetical protein